MWTVVHMVVLALGYLIRLHSERGSFWSWSTMSFSLHLSPFLSLFFSISPSLPLSLSTYHPCFIVCLHRCLGLSWNNSFREVNCSHGGSGLQHEAFTEWERICVTFSNQALRCHRVSLWLHSEFQMLPYSRRGEFYSLLKEHDLIIKEHGG